MKLSIRSLSHYLVIAISLFTIAALPAFAATSPTPAPSNPGQGLEISPPLMERVADPGQTMTLNIRLRNITTGTLVTKAEVDDFRAKDEQGDPQIILDPSETSSYSMKSWVTNVTSLTLAPQEAKTTQATVVIPKNAEPGGHYGVIRFTATPPGIESTGVALSASIGTLVLLNISGNAKEHLSYADFYAAKNGKKSSFFESGPINFVERIKNDGNLHEKPTGTVEIFNIFGHKTATLKINDPPHNILPDSIRRFDQTWTSKWLLGRYRARATLTYGVDKTVMTQTIIFWVFPWRFILIALAIIALAVWLLRRGIKGYNARIIAKANKSQAKK